MKKRTLMLVICLFTMAPAVFGQPLEHGIQRKLSGTQASDRECGLMSARRLPEARTAGQNVNRETGVSYGASARER